MSKKTFKVKLYMSELIYDVQNKTYITGRSRYDGDNHEAVANMQANEDDENANQILRSIGDSYSTLLGKIAEFVNVSGATPSEEVTKTDVLGSASKNIEVSLDMPSNYNMATSDAVTAAMHKYIVNMAIHEWFLMTNKADAADYIARANSNIEQLREAINKRMRPIRSEVVASDPPQDDPVEDPDYNLNNLPWDDTRPPIS